ncbi:MAG: 3-deoxy-D-manno-octulosonic acid transferase [Desulfobulbaceae bacterium]|nr:3-deoxy-D-manno-octulosonic acid transferase [Desulfobulbaceae bacterium]
MVVILPFFLLYARLTGRHLAGLGQRLGFLKQLDSASDRSPRLWLHAASVGEVKAARILISEIRKKLPDAAIIVSTMTEQGQLVARQQLDPEIDCIYAPLDLPVIARRVMRKIRPSVYVCLETELWPNIISQAFRAGVALVLLNGRLSERSFRRYKKVRGLMKEVLVRFSAISAITAGDRKRFTTLGADSERVVVHGNVKHDSIPVSYRSQGTGHEKNLPQSCRNRLGIGDGQTVLVAGSTHKGEESQLIDVFKTVKARVGDLIWVVAPRHLNRIPEIEALFRDHGIRFDRLSNIEDNGRKEEVILVDSMGELAGLYSIATFVFCGGSLVPKGGHNIMEPAAWGRPVFYGPSMKDFADAKELLESVKAGFPISGPDELTRSILNFIERPAEYEAAGQRAREIAMAQQGAARKQVQLIIDCLNRREMNDE